MSIKEYRELSNEELNTELLSLHDERFKLTIKKATGQLSKPHLLRKVRRNIARIKMLMNEKAVV